MKVKVAVFARPGKKVWLYSAYTTWFNPTWEGCCMHEVEVPSRGWAKLVAIEECKRLHRHPPILERDYPR